MARKIIIGLGVVLGVLIILAIISFGSPKAKTLVINQSQLQKQGQTFSKQTVDKIQVFLFHATRRCPTCVAIGKYTGEAINEYFQPELQAGKIEFREINIDLPDNEDLTQKFQAGGSVLFINTIIDGQDHIVENAEAWRLISNPANYKVHLKDTINDLLVK